MAGWCPGEAKNAGMLGISIKQIWYNVNNSIYLCYKFNEINFMSASKICQLVFGMPSRRFIHIDSSCVQLCRRSLRDKESVRFSQYLPMADLPGLDSTNVFHLELFRLSGMGRGS